MGRVILVVEDDESQRLLSRDILSEAGFQVECAVDGIDGWEAFCRSDPAVVVTDMHMPRRDGVELVRMIREKSAHCRIVVVTATMDHEEAQLLAAGANELLRKPFSAAQLVKAVRRQLAGQ